MSIDVIRITARHFVAGIVPHNGRVVNAAPILRYMIHWTGKQVADYCAKKGWQWERVKCDPMQAYTASPASKGAAPAAEPNPPEPSPTLRTAA
jgi:hypothetical protein